MAEKKVKFEDKMKELETIIDELENGTLDLEVSIDKYTKAMKLINECNEQLTDIENKVTKMISSDGKEVEYKVEEDKTN